MYDMKQWQHDRIFNAKVGQQIGGEIYDQFFNTMPPLDLPENVKQYHELDGGFFPGEPYGIINGSLSYMVLGRRNNEYYFLGYATTDGQMANGKE